MNKSRDETIDLLKGFAILLMIFDHVGFGQYVHTYIQSFHMPLFFIVSGYLFNTRKNIKERIKNNFNKLIVPYIAFSSIYLSIYLIFFRGAFIRKLYAVLFFPTDMENMPFAPALWFLPCMFITSNLFTIINKIKINNIFKYIIICTIGIVGLTYSSISDNMLPFTIEPTCVALIFMLIGYLIKNNSKINNLLKLKISYLVTIFVVDTILIFFNGCVDMRSARYYNQFLYILNSTMGTILFWNIMIKIKDLHITKIKKCISYFSVNAMTFICTNQFIISFMKNVLDIENLNVIWQLIIFKLIIFLLTLTIGALINKLIENSKLKVIIGKG